MFKCSICWYVYRISNKFTVSTIFVNVWFMNTEENVLVRPQQSLVIVFQNWLLPGSFAKSSRHLKIISMDLCWASERNEVLLPYTFSTRPRPRTCRGVVFLASRLRIVKRAYSVTCRCPLCTSAIWSWWWWMIAFSFSLVYWCSSFLLDRWWSTKK